MGSIDPTDKVAETPVNVNVALITCETDPTPDVDQTPVNPITSATANENIPHP